MQQQVRTTACALVMLEPLPIMSDHMHFIRLRRDSLDSSAVKVSIERRIASVVLEMVRGRSATMS